YIVAPYEKPKESFASAATPQSQPPPAASPKIDQASPNNIPVAPNQTPNQASPNNIPVAPNQTPNQASPNNLPVAPNQTPNLAPTRPQSWALIWAFNWGNDRGLGISVSGVPATPPPAPAAPPIGYLRYQDPKVGYSFDYPNYWTGQPLSDQEANEQRMNAGAV